MIVVLAYPSRMFVKHQSKGWSTCKRWISLGIKASSCPIECPSSLITSSICKTKTKVRRSLKYNIIYIIILATSLAIERTKECKLLTSSCSIVWPSGIIIWLPVNLVGLIPGYVYGQDFNAEATKASTLKSAHSERCSLRNRTSTAGGTFCQETKESNYSHLSSYTCLNN